MEFTIGQNASLPVLKMQVVKDGTQNFDDMMEFIERSSIFFSMVSTDTGIPKVYTKSAGFVEKLEMNENASPEYYVYYRFTPQDTSRIGRYEGQFMFINDDGTLVLPIREPLFINVVESFISDSLPYNPCYTLNYSCCTTPFPSPTPTPTKFPVISPSATPIPPTPTATPTIPPGLYCYAVYNPTPFPVTFEFTNVFNQSQIQTINPVTQTFISALGVNLPTFEDLELLNEGLCPCIFVEFENTGSEVVPVGKFNYSNMEYPLRLVQPGWFVNGIGVNDAPVLNITQSENNTFTVTIPNDQFFAPGENYTFCIYPQH
jgi:hypothetical protein